MLAAGQRVYLHLRPVDARGLRDDLLACLLPGVYGVSLTRLRSLDQLRYLDSLLEDVEPRAEIAAGLTALGVWIDSAKSLTLAPDLARGSHRLTWLGLDAASLASELDVDAHAGALDHARATVVFAAAANGLPAVAGLAAAGHDAGAELVAARQFRGLGMRGQLTRSEKAALEFGRLYPAGVEPETAEDAPAH